MSPRQPYSGGSTKRAPVSAVPADGEGEFHALVDATPSPIICTDQDGRIAYWNPGASKLFGYEISEAIGQPITQLFPNTTGSDNTTLFDLFTPDDGPAGPYGDCTLPMRHSSGSTVYVEISRSAWCIGDRRLLTIAFRDISERRRRDRRLTRRVRHERAVATIASRLVAPGDLDAAIEESLAEIGRLCGADRAHLFLFDATGEAISNTHEWCEEGATSKQQSRQNVPMHAFTWALAQINMGLTVAVPDIAKLPPEAAAERLEFEREGIKSLLFLPVPIGGAPGGFMGIDNVKMTHTWNELEITLLEACASIIGAALDRRGAEERLRASEERARRLFENSPVSLWQIDYSSVIDRFNQLRQEGVDDFRRYFNDNPQAVVEMTALLKIIDVNKATLDLFQADSKEDFFKGLGTIFTNDSYAAFKKELIALAQGHSHYEGKRVSRALDGRLLHLLVKTFALPGSEQEMDDVLCAFTDITELKKADLGARRRLEYEKVISGLASRLIGADTLEKATNLTLTDVVRFTRADSSFLYLFDKNLENIKQSHRWRADGTAAPEGPEQNLRLDDFPGLVAQLKQGEVIRICDSSQTGGGRPEEFERLAEAGIKSLLVIPISVDKRLAGVIGLSCHTSPHKWGEADLSLLLVASTLLGSALQRRASHEAMRVSENKYRNLIESAGDAIFIADAETGRILDVNREGEKLLSRPASEIIGMHQSDLYAPAEAKDSEERFREFARAEAPQPMRRDLFIVNATGDLIPVQMCASLVDLGDKRIVQGVFRDDTARHQSQGLRTSLNKINSVINSTLHFNTIIELVIIEAAAALGAETAVAFLADADEWIIRCVHNYPDGLAGRRYKKDELSHLNLATRKRHPVAFNDAQNDDRIDLQTMIDFDIKSILVVPLVVRDEPIGCLTFCQHSQVKPFSSTQVHFATQLATATSFALENARLYAEKRNIADALQQSLLTMPKEVAGIHYGNLYRSATRTTRVGGDFYDIFELPGERVGIVIGDVSGKGLEAAKLTSVVKNTLRAYAAEGHSPAQVMKKTNTLTLQVTEPSTFVTVFFGIIDVKKRKLEYCNAGHPPALLKTGAGRTDFLTIDSPALGVLNSMDFCGNERTFKQGDVLFLYTDGATDARQGTERFGDRRLQSLVAGFGQGTIEELPHSIFSELLDFSSAELSDDLALLSVSLA